MTTFASKADRDAWILEERRKGRSQAEIAAQIGVSRPLVALVDRQLRASGSSQYSPAAPADPGRATWESVYNLLVDTCDVRMGDVWKALHQERPLAILGAGILSGFGAEEVAREIARELGWQRREGA